VGPGDRRGPSVPVTGREGVTHGNAAPPLARLFAPRQQVGLAVAVEVAEFHINPGHRVFRDAGGPGVPVAGGEGEAHRETTPPLARLFAACQQVSIAVAVE